jgi:putative ABC transport system permease protein
VVGIVGDVRRSLSRALDPPAYVVPPDDTNRGLTLVARMRVRQAGTLADLRWTLTGLAPDTPVTGVWWSDSISVLTAYRTPRFQLLVLGTFAVLALGLTGLGIFAAVAGAVALRTRELGVRLALGASPRSLVRFAVGRALVPIATGVVFGLIATEWLRRVAVASLFQLDVSTGAALTLGAAVTVVASAALVAAYVPARRASRIDPVMVLRAE